ncbi:MAG TPA: LUD domain-containing protein [Candidatus Binatia bacterium]|nr:LUD domain-containing protein [Candidatus Binatia bacterium]
MSREQILRALRQAPGPVVPLPPRDGPWTIYPDESEQFAVSLAAAGGRCVRVEARTLEAAIEEIATSVQAQRIVSLVSHSPGVSSQTAALEARPHDYDDVDLALCSGAFGVAENGAVWISDGGVPEQSILFLAQHLVLTLDPSQIVHNMHQAYERLSFGERSFGTFIAGPSKTADIEQSLVIGAHGPRSLTVLLTTEV